MSQWTRKSYIKYVIMEPEMWWEMTTHTEQGDHLLSTAKRLHWSVCVLWSIILCHSDEYVSYSVIYIVFRFRVELLILISEVLPMFHALAWRHTMGCLVILPVMLHWFLIKSVKIENQSRKLGCLEVQSVCIVSKFCNRDKSTPT